MAETQPDHKQITHLRPQPKASDLNTFILQVGIGPILCLKKTQADAKAEAHKAPTDLFVLSDSSAALSSLKKRGTMIQDN